MGKITSALVATASTLVLLTGLAGADGNGKRLLKTITRDAALTPPGITVSNQEVELANTAVTLKCPAKVKRCMIELDVTTGWRVLTTVSESFGSPTMGGNASINGVKFVRAGLVSGSADDVNLLSHWRFTKNVGPGTYAIKFFAGASDSQRYVSHSVTASIYAR